MKYNLDKYSLIQSEMMISLYKKDKEKAIQDLEKAITDLDKIISGSFQGKMKSKLYDFRKSKSNTFDLKQYKSILKQTIHRNSDYDFIRDDPRVRLLMKKLDV